MSELAAPMTESEARASAQLFERARYELKKVIVGQDALLDRLLVAILAGGHVLVEGAPGLAKTLTLNTLAQILSVSFKRIQFTPDLLPADLIGTRIYNPAQSAFSTELGPVFAHFILADEINRAPAKVQSALLEAMQERQVTIGRETFPLSAPFLVMATQNPIESEGTYPLPEAQLDRFLFKLLVTYPDAREELAILNRHDARTPALPEAVVSEVDLCAAQQQVSRVFLAPELAHYVVDLVQATRRCPDVLQFGASPRGSLSLSHSAKALALLRGRNYVLPEDVSNLAKDCLRHRVGLSYDALADGKTPDAVLDALMATLTLPGPDAARPASGH